YGLPDARRGAGSGVGPRSSLRVIACDKRKAFAQGSESDEAIHLSAMPHDRLLRFARNDDRKKAGIAPGLSFFSGSSRPAEAGHPVTAAVSKRAERPRHTGPSGQAGR